VKLASLLLLSLLLAAPAHAQAAMDPGDDKWNEKPAKPGDKGKLTMSSDRPLDAPAPPPPVPLWVSAPATLIMAGAGFALMVPQLSIYHVLGYRDGGSRPLGYLGLGVLALSPALGLALSGGSLGTVIMGPILEAAFIGLAFGGADLANYVRTASSSVVGKIAVDDVLGIGLVVLDVAFMVAASLFPVVCAFLPGAALDQEDERELAPLDAVGLLPIRGGAVLSVAWRLP
jgi:hypothetical protein